MRLSFFLVVIFLGILHQVAADLIWLPKRVYTDQYGTLTQQDTGSTQGDGLEQTYVGSVL